MIVAADDGTHIHVQVEGPTTAPPVLLAHSLGSDASIWDGLAMELAGRFRVVRYDSRGHGESDAPDEPYSNAMLAGDTLAVMDALGIAKASFVGLSMGGMTGMWLAAYAADRIDALVLANTATFIPNKQMWDDTINRARSEGLQQIAAETLARWFSPAFQSARPAEFQHHVAMMAAMSVEGYAGSCAVLRDVDLRAAITTIDRPTLVIAGAQDMPAAIDGAKAMVEVIRGSRLYVVPDAAHLSPIENSAAFNRAVFDFLYETAGS